VARRIAHDRHVAIDIPRRSAPTALPPFLPYYPGRPHGFLEEAPGGSDSHPSVLQAADGLVLVSYSHADPAPDGTERREAIRHVAFDPAWVAAGE